MKYKSVIIVSAILLIMFCAIGCIDDTTSVKSPQTQKTVPTKVAKDSLERQLINRWIDEESNPNNVMWLYQMSDTGQVLGEWPVVGKVVSMTKSNEPYERVTDYSGVSYDDENAITSFEGYRAGTAQLANPSGTYGHDLDGVFFFTPDGEYHEIHGGILHISSVPLKINSPVFLTYDVDKEKQEKEKIWEDELKNGKQITNYNNTSE